MFSAARDATFLASNASYQLSVVRRSQFKSVFDEDHSELCDIKNPVSTMLFGDDLAKSCKEISDETSAMSKAFSKKKPVVNKSTRGRGIPKKSSRGTNWSRKPQNQNYSSGYVSSSSFRGRGSSQAGYKSFSTKN